MQLDTEGQTLVAVVKPPLPSPGLGRVSGLEWSMSAISAPLLVPSQLPADAGEWVRSFAARVRDEVAAPLFAAPTAAAYDEALPEYLARGAALRFRWLTSLGEMPDEQATALLNEWMRPPPSSALTDLQRRTSGLLGTERSFQLQRAFALTFTDAVEGWAAVLERWRSLGEATLRLVELGRIAETAAPQEVLALAWMMVLFGDIPTPVGEVADAAASALLRLTAERLHVLEAVVRSEIGVDPVTINHRRLPPDWLRQHPVLVSPLLTLMGLACDDDAILGLELVASRDPDEDDVSIVELRLQVQGNPDEALERLETRALRAGALGVLSDDRGGLIALISEAVDRA